MASHHERLGPLAAILLALATFCAGTARAEPLAIVPASEADGALTRYLARALPDAAIRADLSGVSLADARARATTGAVLSVDVRRGLLRAMRSGSAEVFERRFDPEVAERSPYAIVVAVAELLALPSVPAPPVDVGGATAAEGGAVEAPGDAQPDGVAEGQADGDIRGGAAVREDGDPRVDDREPDEGREPEDDVGVTAAVADDQPARLGFLARLAYTLFASGDPSILLHRPSLELGASVGTPALRGVATVSADVLGVAETSTPNGATVTLRRQDLWLALGLVLGVGRLELEGGGFAGMSISRAEAVRGTEEGASERLGVTVGAYLGAAVVLGAGLRLFVTGGLGVDPGATRVLAGGEPAFGDGPLFGRFAAGLGWASP